MYEEKNKATCRRFIQQTFNEGDLSSIWDFISPDAIHHELDSEFIPMGRSPERYAEMIDLYRIAFPDLRVEIQAQVAESDRVVTCLRVRGTQAGPLMGIGVSGKAVDFTGIRVDRLAEGKIAESWFHWDALGMLQQIGALPDLARNPLAAPWNKDATAVTEMPRPSVAQLQQAA